MGSVNQRYFEQNSGESWSFATIDDVTRFEVRSGDHWFGDGGAPKERSEISSLEKLDLGKTYSINFSMMVEPGVKNTADWLTLVQIKDTADAGEAPRSPPFAIELLGDRMRIVTRDSSAAISTPANINYHAQYTDAYDIVRGHWYDFQIKIKFDSQGSGSLDVLRDGLVLVHYSGPLGYNDVLGPVWKEGIYRAAAAETIAVDFSPVTISESAGQISAPAIQQGWANPTGRHVVVESDGSRKAYQNGIVGKDYVSEADFYDAAGRLTAVIRTHSDNSLAFSFKLDADGRRVVDKYDAAGILTSDSVTSVDGSTDIKSFTNGKLTNETFRYVTGPISSIVKAYDTAGRLQSSKITYSDWSSDLKTYASGLLVTEEFKFSPGSGKSADTKSFIAGTLARETIVNRDGSKDVYDFASSGGKTYVTKHDTFDALGHLTQEMLSRLDGSISKSFVELANGTSTTNQYDQNGHLSSSIIVNSDGSSSSRAYVEGRLASESIKYAAESNEVSDLRIFSGDLMVRETAVHRDGSKDVYFLAPSSAAFFAEHDHYGVSGSLDRVERTNADGSLAYQYFTNAFGAKVVVQYDKHGNPLSISTQYVDGKLDIEEYSGGILARETIKFAQGGDLATDLKIFVAGRISSESITRFDGSRDLYKFSLGDSVSDFGQHYHYDASGQLTSFDETNPDGSHSSALYSSGLTWTSSGDSDLVANYLKGDNTFAFNQAFGKDTISNFHSGNGVGHDRIAIDDRLVQDISHLEFRALGHDTLIVVDANDTILLKGVDASTLTANNFEFVHHDWVLA